VYDRHLPAFPLHSPGMRKHIAIVGLGYVGLPLAYAFAQKGYTVSGFDISEKRIEELGKGEDRTRELTAEELRSVTIAYSTDPAILKDADIIIVAVPTPVDEENKPDLSYVESSARIVGKNLKKGAIVVYEATVYPGVTEEICGALIAEESGLACGTDFMLGYSPERINPGDKLHTVTKIRKIVAGQDAETLETLAELYGSIVEAGIHRAPSIKVAEMAKAIENAQRDLNIAYVNEVALLCGKLGIRTKDVLEAAGTKWNFLKFQPGLVGGHCIGVDPYYLVEKARQLGMTTQVITAGRAVNDGMSAHVALQVIAALPRPAAESRVLVLGLTFKENIPDTRNSKAADVVKTLQKAGCIVEAEDPEVHASDFERIGFPRGSLEKGPYDAIVLLVPHAAFTKESAQTYVAALAPKGVFYDLKSSYAAAAFTDAGKTYLAL
jgi:UDP-N-acetyl-D-galactosamine dehydrogenase